MLNDQRKHRVQMTPREIQHTEAFIRVPRKWAIRDYARDRMRQRNFQVSELAKALRQGQIIEVHQNAFPEIRAVVRFNTVCVAVSLSTFEIVTIWWNAAHDQHSTLDLTNYKWRINLLEIIQG